MSNTPGYNETVVCPYNKSHLILRERLQFHLVRCAKNYPEVILKKCPFNTVHLVVESNMEEHVKSCEDRYSFEVYKYNIAPTSIEEPTAGPSQPPIIESVENWDQVDHPPYNPQSYVERANIVRTMNVAKPSEKKAFREAERLRLTDLEKRN